MTYTNSTYARNYSLDPLEYTFNVYGYVYNDDFLLYAQDSVVLAQPMYSWSIQLCNGADNYSIEYLEKKALESLDSPYIDEKWASPQSKVFGKYGDVSFYHFEPINWYGTKPEEFERLQNRIIRVQGNLYNTGDAKIYCGPRLVELMDKDFIYEPSY